MTPARLTLALLCFSPVALGAAPYLGSPWPGVAFAVLALVPLAGEQLSSARGEIDELAALRKELAEVQDDVRSLKNRATMKGIGG